MTKKKLFTGIGQFAGDAGPLERNCQAEIWRWLGHTTNE